jgi:predicted extracellular nuclease
MKYIVFALSVTCIAACGGGGGTATTATPGPPASGGTQISDVQGSGDVSPLSGQTVTVSGIVSGDFQDNDADTARDLGGFYVQQETPDSDPMSSEGLFVFDGSAPATNVDIGDRVEITGSVAEYFGETQINAASVAVTGTGMVQATDVNLPTTDVITNSDGDPIADLERFEGMLLRFPQQLTVSSLRFLEQYGEVGLSQAGRQYQFTNANVPDVTAYAAHRDTVATRSIILNDGLRTSNPSPLPYLNAGVAADYSIRVGDSINGAIGNLRYSRGSGAGGLEGWRLVPTENVQFDDDNPRPGSPSVAGSIRVASFNMQNFFSNIDSGQPTCGPQGNQNCRGADSAAELSRQIEKNATTMSLMGADIIGLIELENNATESLATTVDALNNRVGAGGSYAYVDTGTIHTDGIKTGFVYDSATIRETGSFAILDSSVDPRFNDGRNRPALAQSFEVIATGAVFTVLVNHLKSKGSSCDSIADPNNSDGQANCNLTRTNAAAAIADWVTTDPTASGDNDFLIIGDLNAYLVEDPLTALKNAGLTSLLESNPNAYSYNFDAQSGALDHAVASASLVSQVSEVIEWHINADEPPLLDYNFENGRDAALFDPDSPYRASDHDPVIIGLDLTN